MQRVPANKRKLPSYNQLRRPTVAERTRESNTLKYVLLYYFRYSRGSFILFIMSAADATPEVPADSTPEKKPERKTYQSIQDFGLKADRNSRHRRTMEVGI